MTRTEVDAAATAAGAELGRRLLRIALWHSPSRKGFCAECGAVWPCRTFTETGQPEELHRGSPR